MTLPRTQAVDNCGCMSAGCNFRYTERHHHIGPGGEEERKRGECTKERVETQTVADGSARSAQQEGTDESEEGNLSLEDIESIRENID